MEFKDYEKISVATDVVMLAGDIRQTNEVKSTDDYILKILLIKRNTEPSKGKWALPGGFMDADKTADEAVKNKLKLKTGLEDYYQEQLYTYTDVDRDSRGRVISISYLALLRQGDVDITQGSNEAQWFTVGIVRDEERNIKDVKVLDDSYNIIELAFDHNRIIRDAIIRIANKIMYTDIAFYLVPEEFTLRGLQDIYEFLLGKEFLAFRRFIAPKVEETGRMQYGTGYRPSKFFRKKD